MLKISLPKQILIAIIVGAFLGILLGEDARLFKPIGSAFIMFTQMVVLPYIPASIIHGIGSTNPKITKNILKEGWLFLLFIWGLTFSAIFLLSLLFPSPLAATIVNTQKKHTPIAQNFLNYLIPQNPIYDFANNIVPAVAIFGIIIGVAIMHLRYKEPLISFIERVNNIIEMILIWLTRIAPIGIAAIFANTFGTVYPHEIGKLLIYVVPLVGIVLLLSFWVFPAVLMSFTHLNYDNIINEYRRICFLAFILGNPSISFPFLNASVRRYAAKYDVHDRDLHSLSQSVVPLSYSFAQIGNLLIVFFVLFLSFYFRHPISTLDKIFVSFFSIPLSFGGPDISVNAISFLLPRLEFPKAAFEIYDQTSVVTANFTTLLSVTSMYLFTILVLEAYYHKLYIRLWKLSKHFIIFFIVLSLLVFLIKPFVKKRQNYLDIYESMNMESVIAEPPPVTIITPEDASNYPWKKNDSPVLATILESNEIKVGYNSHAPPFNYFNFRGKLVGYDIAFAYMLAKFLQCKLILLPFQWENLATHLDEGHFDIAMAPIPLTQMFIQKLILTQSYKNNKNVLIIPMDRMHDFSSFSLIKDKPLKLGIFPGFDNFVRSSFPHATFQYINSLDHAKKLQLDAIFTAKDEALVFCRKFPQYVIMEYGLDLGNVFFSYAVRRSKDQQLPLNFLTLIQQWLNITTEKGFAEQQESYWIEGKIPLIEKQRWSLIKDVFHWKN